MSIPFAFSIGENGLDFPSIGLEFSYSFAQTSDVVLNSPEVRYLAIF
jgi:hypothetical protein